MRICGERLFHDLMNNICTGKSKTWNLRILLFFCFVFRNNTLSPPLSLIPPPLKKISIVAVLKFCKNFAKPSPERDPNTSVLRTPILENICERLLLRNPLLHLLSFFKFTHNYYFIFGFCSTYYLLLSKFKEICSYRKYY